MNGGYVDMLEAFSVVASGPTHDNLMQVELTFEERQKSRYLTETLCKQPLAWFIERGYVLADGDLLDCGDKRFVTVIAALEPVSQILSDDKLLLTRAAYHLGNRHVPLQINDNQLIYQHDHVLDEMIKGLGLTVNFGRLPFQPENGAYHSSSHTHSHD